MAGIDHLKQLIVVLATLVNVVVRVAKGKFLALLELGTVLRNLGAFDLVSLRAELVDLDAAERADLDAAFAGALDLDDKTLQAKIAQAEDLLTDLVDVAIEGIAVVQSGLGIVAKFRALLGL